MPGVWEEPGPGGATLYMGGCWELGVGAWGAVQSGWRRAWCDRKGSLFCALRKEQCHCWAQVAAPSLGGQHGPGSQLCFLSSVPQAPMYLVGQQTLSLVLASRLKGQVPPTGAQSHQGRGCSHQEGVLFLFIIKLLGTLQCWFLVSSCLVPGREEGRMLGPLMSVGVKAKTTRPSRDGSHSPGLPASLW